MMGLLFFPRLWDLVLLVAWVFGCIAVLDILINCSAGHFVVRGDSDGGDSLDGDILIDDDDDFEA